MNDKTKPFRPGDAIDVLGETEGDFVLPLCLPKPSLLVGEDLAMVVLDTILGQRVGLPLSLQGAADLLEDEREDLAAALRNLGTAMTAVRGFVNENEASLSRNIKGLVKVTDVFVKRRKQLDETLQVAPVALSNLFHTYNPATGTLDTRTNVGENIANLTTDPVGAVCSILAAGSDGNTSRACDTLRQALPRTAPLGAKGSPAAAATTTTDVEHVDRSLGGILEVRG